MRNLENTGHIVLGTVRQLMLKGSSTSICLITNLSFVQVNDYHYIVVVVIIVIIVLFQVK